MANLQDGWGLRPARPEARAAQGHASATIFSLLLASACFYAAIALAFGLEAQVPLVATGTLAGVCLLAARGLSAHPHPRFGYANTVTMLRAAFACLAGAIVLCADALAQTGPLVSLLIVLAALALVMDGVDGYLARRFGQSSDFGARFDMETDAFLILVLALAAVMLDKTGPWILAIGLMRYAFITGQWLEPRLAAPLPPSFRRKLVCVLQVVALLGLMLPAVASPLSDALAAVALAALVYSFGADCAYLLRRTGTSA